MPYSHWPKAFIGIPPISSPSSPNTEVTSRGNADRDALVDSMEEEFTRASFLQKAGEMGIKSETASTWLKRMQKHGLVENVDGKGNYRKPKSLTFTSLHARVCV